MAVYNAFYEATVGEHGLHAIAGKAHKYDYFRPFFDQFTSNANPAPLVSLYGRRDRTTLIEQGLHLDLAEATPYRVLDALYGPTSTTIGISGDICYRNVAGHLARQTDPVAYHALTDRIAQLFLEQERIAPEHVDDFVEVSHTLIEYRKAPGFADAYLVHLLGCCIIEPGLYLQELLEICNMDGAAFSQAFGTRPTGEHTDGTGAPAPAERANHDFSLEEGGFAPMEGDGIFFVPVGADTLHGYRMPDDKPNLTVEVGRSPLHDGERIELDDPCVSVEHLTVRARRSGCLTVTLEDHSSQGTVVLRQTPEGTFEEMRLGQVVSGGSQGGRQVDWHFTGYKKAPSAPTPTALRDGDLIIPAPRFSFDDKGNATLDLLACPTVLKLTIAR